MKVYGKVPGVPQNGIVAYQEGALMRIFFDIRDNERPASEGDDDGMRMAVDPENDKVMENVDIKAPFSYGAIVSAIVNDRYTADDVQALQANYIEAMDEESDLAEEKREEYLEEYAAFQQWRRKAKEIAKEVAP